MVREELVARKQIESPHQIVYRYPRLDPLQWILPTSVTAWTGPPDLEFDCYRGPVPNGRPGWMEVSAQYQLYRFTGNQVSSWEPHPVLIEELFGVNLVQSGNRYYGIPANEGAFTKERFSATGYSRRYEAKSLAELRGQVRRAAF